MQAPRPFMLPSRQLRSIMILPVAIVATFTAFAAFAQDTLADEATVSASEPYPVSSSIPSDHASSDDSKVGEMPFDLFADNITYDVSGSKVTASGADPLHQVHVKSAKGDVWADKIDYDLAANKVYAVGNVKLINPDKTTLIVDKLELTGDMQRGALDELRLRMPALGEIAKATTATVSGTTYTMTDVEYSPCKECIGNRKPWTLTADKMVYDKDAGKMTYNNAVMDVYGVPVMYLPWFRHPIGPKQPENGLLPPVFGRSDSFGENITISGYIFNPAENADYTIRNRLMSDRGSQFMLERRQSTLTTDSKINGSYLNDTETSQIRSHLKIEAEKDFSASQRIGLNGEVASDDSYLSQYFDRLDPYLASTLYGEDTGDQHYAALSMTRFQDLDPTHRDGDTPQVYPHLELERWFVPHFGGQTELTADVANIYRTDGLRSRRFVGEAAYSRPFMLDDGSKITFGATGRGDLYVIDNGANNGTITRILPEATAMWEKPYISPGGYHTIAPQVLLAVSPRGGNNNNKVPNEDSASYELDVSNLFEPSRFAGLDRVETGPRLIYGFDNRWGTPDHTDVRIFLGQSLRKYDDSSLPLSGGHATNSSDWVGSVDLNPYKWMTLGNRFRVDNGDFAPRRSDTFLTLGEINKTYFRVTHSYLDNGPHEISTEFNLPLNDAWAFKGKTRNDLANSTMLENQGGFVWTRDCYQIEAMIRRRGYVNGDLQPGTDYLVNLKLLTLGSED